MHGYVQYSFCSGRSAGPFQLVCFPFFSSIVHLVSCLAEPTLAIAASEAGSGYEAYGSAILAGSDFRSLPQCPVLHTSIISYLQLLCLAQLCGRLDSRLYGNSAQLPG